MEWVAFASTLPVIAWKAGPDGTVEQWNDRWFATTGTSPSTPLADWSAKLHPEDRSAWPDALRRFTSQPVPFGGVFRVWSVAHGAYRLHLARVAPNLDPQGVVVSWS
ncbi:MAG TPA: PAS domain-containing protein, partial [Candidatus Acidoferrum sp.]|nr:PAS domain-containing protein [Candidatus Acidoferrum sp.]